jgi:hypothetical protein
MSWAAPVSTICLLAVRALSRKREVSYWHNPDLPSHLGSDPLAGHGPAAQPIKVEWRQSVCDGIYKVSDVIIEGLSMAANGRFQLEGVVERNGGRAQAICSRRNAATNCKRFWSLNLRSP